MFRISVLVSAALSIFVSVPGRAEDQSNVAKIKLIVGDGPYEIKGESGVIGYVVSTVGETVTFKPCTGKSFPIDRRRLRSTKNNCDNSPSADEHPFVIQCEDALQGWDKEQFFQAIGSEEPIGTAFFQKDGEAKSVPADVKEIENAIDVVYRLKNCGKFVVGVDKEGVAKLSLIQAIQPMTLDGAN